MKNKPQAQPIPDEADLPKGELVVRPKAQPQTQPKADNPTAPTIENVPSPYKNQPNPPQIDPTKVIPPILAAGSTASISKVITDKVNEDLAPNGVSNINKREWSEVEYKQWFNNLPMKTTPANELHDIYEILVAGDTNYQLQSGDIKFWTDGIENRTILEAKYVGKPEKSPYVEDSKYPAFLRQETDAKTRSEFERMGKILRDPNNPLTSVRVITSDERAVPYFEKLMREYGIPGEVIVAKSPEIKE